MLSIILNQSKHSLAALSLTSLQPIILLQLPIVYYYGEEDDGEETSKEERGGEE